MLVDGVMVMSQRLDYGWQGHHEGGRRSAHEGQLFEYPRAGGNFPRDQCLVRTGVQRAGVQRDDGLVMKWLVWPHPQVAAGCKILLMLATLTDQGIFFAAGA
jgi:hypothetical protein